MSGMNAGIFYRSLLLKLAVSLQMVALMLPSYAHAQTNHYGSPYSFNESTLTISQYNSGNYTTFNAALNAARVKFIADTKSPTSQCPLDVSVFSYLGQITQARIDYTGSNDAFSCGNGTGYGVTYVYASLVNYDLGKNAGGCACDGGNGHEGGPPPGRPLKGEPINIATGNKFEQDTDYVAPTSRLTFRRFYNGLVAVDPTTLGTTWRHSFDRSLKFASSVSIMAYRPDGRFEKFSKNNNGVWTPDADITDILTQQSDANGNATGYTLFVATSQQFEQYSTTGLLLSAKDEAGQVITLTYSTTSTPVSIAPAPNLLLTVTDPNDRVLQFTYDSSARLHTVTQPDSGVLTYGYDAATGDLTSVQYPDGKIRQYVYNEASLTGGANLPGVLTGVIDETSVRYASTTYDSTGRATSASLAGGVDAMTVTYGTSTGTTPTTITTALGVSTSLGFQNILGALKVASSSQTCSASCNQPWQSLRYDANGYPASATDFNGNVTATTYDANGLLDQQMDASGTANQRTTNSTWNTTLRVPLTQTVLNAAGTTTASTAWVYNAAGQTLARCDIDPANPAASGYTCSNTGTVPAGVRRWTYTYCTAVGTGCPIVGLMLSATGPRTDLTQTTTYSYYTSPSATGCGTPGSACYQPGDLYQVTDPLGHVTTIASYDGAGRVTRVTDANGVNTDLTYTPRGWLASRTVGGSTTSFSYTPYGAVQTITDPDNVTTTYTYDAAHRLTRITDALGNYVQYTLDAAGNKTAEQTYDSSGTVHKSLSRTFNTLGQLTAVVDGLSHTVFNAGATGSYDANGNLVHSADGLNIQRQQGYDALNRLVSTIDNYNGTDPATQNTTTGTVYDALDRVNTVTDPSSLTTTYTYDGLNDRTGLQSPDSGTSGDQFDAAGNRTQHTDARGVVTQYTYDALNRLTGKIYPVHTALNVTYTYDQAAPISGCTTNFNIGHLTSMTDASGSTAWCYTNQGDIREVNQVIKQVVGTTTTNVSYLHGYAYSAARRLIYLQYPSGFELKYGYDGDGRVSTIGYLQQSGPYGSYTNSTLTPLITAVTYAPFGPVTGYSWAQGGQYVLRSYDPNYALTDLTSSTNALTLHFQRDTMGRIGAEGTAPGANPLSESYQYDPLSRLKELDDSNGVLEQSYTYNPTGDRTTKTVAGQGTFNYGYQSGSHWLTSVGSTARTLDANGNTTAMTDPLGSLIGLGYDDRNLLTTVTSGGITIGAYQYNGQGVRVWRTITSPSVAQAASIYDPTGTGNLYGEYFAGDYREYVYLDGIPVASATDAGRAAPGINYLYADPLGSVRAVLNPQGQGTYQWPWLDNAFGELPTTGTGNFYNRFPGQNYDVETGLHYNGARYYDPGTGRYLQSDPIGLAGGISTYAYVVNSPLNAIDPLGLACNAQGCWNTPEETAYANAGDYHDYYATACANGDPYACRAGEVADNAEVSGIRGPLTKITNLKLRASLHKNLPAMPCDVANQIVDQEMENIRKGLAQARVAQLAGASENDPLMVPKSAISDFHHQVFADNGADPNVFGGDQWDAMHGEAISSLLGDRYDWCSSPACKP